MLSTIMIQASWQDVFNPFEIITLHLEVNTSDWDRVRFDQPSQSETWIPEVAEAWFYATGEEPIRVTIRRKGESDPALPSDADPRKVSLKIDINEVVPGQRWRGLRKLSLENGGTDTLREGVPWILHRRAAEAGYYAYDAALSGWVLLYINSDIAGVYVNAEQRDETFLRNHDMYSPTESWLYKVDGSTSLEIGIGDSPAKQHLTFSPFNAGPGGGPGGKPGGGGGGGDPQPDLDVDLRWWVDMESMLTLAACNAFAENRDSLFTHSGKNSFAVDFNPPYPRTRRYFPWDLDTCISDGSQSIYGSQTYQVELLEHPWFGRVYEHILRELLEGAFSESALHAVLDELYLRLNDAFTLDPYVYPGGIANEVASLKEWATLRRQNVLAQLTLPYVPRPAFSHPGGEVVSGYELVMTAASGTVYYTTDGSDPRAPGDSVSASATAVGTALVISKPTTVIARTLNGTNWSGLAQSAAFSLADYASSLRVTEIMYNPRDPNTSDGIDNDAYEFIEFHNAGPDDLELAGFTTDGIIYDFPAGSRLAPGAYMVLARNPSAFSNRYPGVTYDGIYLGKLSNNGEKVRVRDSSGNTILSVEYDDDPPWVMSPDGMGPSLVNRNPDGNPDDPRNWRPSAYDGGSPGTGDPAPPFGQDVVINEVLAHTDPPLEDAIELCNVSGIDVDISGWYLSDAGRLTNGLLDASQLKRYRIPDGTVLPPGGFYAVYERSFNGPEAAVPFALSEYGERVYLSSADTNGTLDGYVVAEDIPATNGGVAVGRYRSSVAQHFVPLSTHTFGVAEPASLPEFRQGNGATNAPPRVGPIVINEIMYNPSSNDYEYVELLNITSSDVDVSKWDIDGMSIRFPEGTLFRDGAFSW